MQSGGCGLLDWLGLSEDKIPGVWPQRRDELPMNQNMTVKDDARSYFLEAAYNGVDWVLDTASAQVIMTPDLSILIMM